MNSSLNRLISVPCLFAQKIDQKKLDAGILISAFLLTVIQLFYEIMDLRYLWLYIPSCILVLFIVFAGLSNEIKVCRPHPLVLICWGTITLFVGLNGVLKNTDDLSEFLILSVVLPLFYVVWGNQCNRLFPLVAKGVSLSFVVYFLISIISFPIQGDGYSGLFANVNSAAMYLTAVWVCMLAVLMLEKQKLVTTILLCISLGVVGSLLFYTTARGGILASFVSTFLFMVFLLIRKQNKKALLLKVLSVCVAVWVCIYGLIPVIQCVQREISVHKSDFPQTEVESLEEIFDNGFGRFTEKTNDLNAYTSGRVDLWKTYGKELGFFGHSVEEVVYDYNNNIEQRSSHLTQLQFAYQYGLPVGIAVLIFHIFSGIQAIKLIFVKKERLLYEFFPLVVIIAYGAYSIFEANVVTFGRIIILLYYFAVMPLISKLNSKTVILEDDNKIKEEI